MPTPEQEAREHIDVALDAAGWTIQHRWEMNLSAGPGIAVREFPMAPSHGFADYMLFVDAKAVGILEAKPAGYPLTSVELQADKYATGLPDGLNPPVNPLPFLYLSTGVETRFINLLDPDPKTRAISRNLPHIHRPSTLLEWLRADTLHDWVKRLHQEGGGFYTAADDTRPSALRSRLQTLPPLDKSFLFPNQVEAVTNLEHSLKQNRPRALIQMATGTDIRPIEIVMFMRAVKSRVLFEQMKGRGVRFIDTNELKAVTPDADAKTHFVIVDCVGMTDTQLADTQPLERKKTVAFKTLLEHVSMGGTDPDILSSLASRLSRLAKQCGPEEHAQVAAASGGASLSDISRAIVHSLDPDRQMAEARKSFEVPADTRPTEDQVTQAAASLLKRATKPIATRPALRTLLQNLKREVEQIIDEVSQDELLEAGASEEAKEKAKGKPPKNDKWKAKYKEPVGQANVNGTKLKACAVPLPPEREQTRIVIEMDRFLSLASQLTMSLTVGQLRCARLRQSILKWAFEGKLVDQDPDDEPAAALLERIKTEREMTARPARKRAAKGRAKAKRTKP